MHARMYWGWVSMDEVVAEVKKLGPHWDKKGGADHIFVVTADPGRCQYPQEIVRKSIFLTHMGMLQKLGSVRYLPFHHLFLYPTQLC